MPPRLLLQYSPGSATDSPDQRLGREVQDRVDPVGQHVERRCRAGRPATNVAPAGHRVGVPGRQVVEHGDLVTSRDQLGSDDAADVARATGDEQSHGSPVVAGLPSAVSRLRILALPEGRGH